MADVVLVQPNVGNWDTVRSHPSIPLALLSASRMVAKEFDVCLIDQRTDRNWRQALIHELQKRPLCVGMTSITGNQISYALEAARIVKENSRVPVVWGGIHASLLPQSTIDSSYVDIVVKGEGEVAFLELVRGLAAGRDTFCGIEGLWYKKNGTSIANPDRDFCCLDELPPLPYHLIDMEKYLPKFRGRRTMYLETSRGCPNQCAFCYNQSYHVRKWRPMSAERVVEDIERVVKDYDIRSFYIIDDNFFVGLPRFRQITEGLIRQNLDIIWEAQGITVHSAIKMDKDDLMLLEKCGCKKVHFGIESGSENILRGVKKNINVTDVLEVNRKFKHFDIILQYNFMAGFPSETNDDIQKTVDLIFHLMEENKKAIISPICPYTPYPGTALFQQALKEGFIKKSKLEEWSDTNYGDNIWKSEEKSRFLNSLFFSSMFLDIHRLKDMIGNPLYKILIYLYRPIARYRVKSLCFRFMPEIKWASLLIKD